MQSWTDDLTFASRIMFREEFMVDSMTARYPGPVAVKQGHIITPLPQCLTVCSLSCCNVVFGFHQMVDIKAKQLHRTLFQKCFPLVNNLSQCRTMKWFNNPFHINAGQQLLLQDHCSCLSEVKSKKVG